MNQPPRRGDVEAPRRIGAAASQAGVGAATPPSIYGFSDYREYLRRIYQDSKAVDRRFSCRYVASRVGFRSASFFSQILHGRSELTPSMALRFAAFLRLGTGETDYLEALVLCARASSVAERRRRLDRLAELRRQAGDGVSESDAEVPDAPLDVDVSGEGARLVEEEAARFRERVRRIAREHPGGTALRVACATRPA